MPRSDPPSRVARGRPAGFDRRAVVEKAMKLFWERGYEGTSYDALIEAMGMSASSLQRAFGSKERLFQEALTYYGTEYSTWFREALDHPGPTYAVFEAMVEATAHAFTESESPRGCLVSLAALQVGPTHSAISDAAAGARMAARAELAARIRSGIDAGDVPATTDPDAVALFFDTVFRGMAIQARDGADLETLRTIGRLALQQFPR